MSEWHRHTHTEGGRGASISWFTPQTATAARAGRISCHWLRLQLDCFSSALLTSTCPLGTSASVPHEQLDLELNTF